MASADWVERPREAAAVRLKLDAAADRGRLVARLDHASARVLHDVDLTLHGGERIAITGANGAGKTTLLQMLAANARGSARMLPQHHDATGPILQWFPANDESEARTLLAHFGLGADAIHRPLERLSPGQRARAAIAGLVASQADLLLLDEPTNHLDFDTLEVLERALAASPSTIVAVSHDRWFLDAIGVTRRLHVGNGGVSELC
jgi:ATPase subunit of ABC transporter with duplicated ATPase domains